MKKLLILAAAIVAGVAANAASFKWTASNVYSSDTTTKLAVGSTVTLYSFLSSAEQSTAVVATTFTLATAGTINTTFSSDAYTTGSNYSFYFVVEDNDKTFTSAVVANKTAQATTTTTVGFGSMATATQNASNWASSGGGEPVPEPTSGLLMLIGAAGLALRRRRA